MDQNKKEKKPREYFCCCCLLLCDVGCGMWDTVPSRIEEEKKEEGRRTEEVGAPTCVIFSPTYGGWVGGGMSNAYSEVSIVIDVLLHTLTDPRTHTHRRNPNRLILQRSVQRRVGVSRHERLLPNGDNTHTHALPPNVPKWISIESSFSVTLTQPLTPPHTHTQVPLTAVCLSVCLSSTHKTGRGDFNSDLFPECQVVLVSES